MAAHDTPDRCGDLIEKMRKELEAFAK